MITESKKTINKPDNFVDFRLVMWDNEPIGENSPIFGGEVTINGQPFEFSVWRNDFKSKPSDPDYKGKLKRKRTVEQNS